MRFQHLWPLFLLILIPVIILMYILKQKAIRKKVSSTFLWSAMYRNRESDTPWEKLKKNKLLIIQIITVLVLVFALMGPYLNLNSLASENVAILIDNSAGMSMKLTSGKTRLEAAKKSACEFVSALSPNTEITVITCNSTATVLMSATKDRAGVIQTIKKISETNLAGDCACGIETCKGLAQNYVNFKIALFTDTYVYFPGLSETIYDFAGNPNNACVEYVSTGLKNGKPIVLANVTNFGMEEFTTDLNLYGDNELLRVQSVTLAPNESKTVYFEDVEYYGHIYSVEINTEDALLKDNRSFAVSQDRKDGNILLFTKQNLYLEKAIQTSENIHLVKTDDVLALETFESEDFDLFIFDGIAPEKLPAKGNLLFINVDRPELFEFEDKLENVYVKVENTKISEYIKGYSFGCTGVNTCTPPIWAESFLTAGKKSAGFIGETQGRKIAMLGFDLHSSEFPLSIEYPMLMYNLVETMTNTTSLSDNSVYCGDTVRINTIASRTDTSIVDPNGVLTSLKPGVTKFKNAETIGSYIFNNGNSYEFFVVNFNTSESRSSGTASDLHENGNVSVIDATKTETRNLRNFVIIAILAIMAVEWIVYIRS